MRRRRPRRLAQRALGIALKEPGFGEQMRGLIDGHARLARPDDVRFRGDAIAKRERDPRLQHAGRLVVGIGLERVQQFHPRGADVAIGEGGGAAFMGRALLARAAGEAEGKHESSDSPQPVRAEPVEALLSPFPRKREGKPFDGLRANGAGIDPFSLSPPPKAARELHALRPYCLRRS
jgi:hypothetical protein